MPSITKKTASYQQGGRTAYTFAVTFQEIEDNLPRRLPDSFAEMLETNRVLDPKRADAIEKYIATNPKYVLPPITLGCDHNAISIKGDNITISNDGDQDKIRIIDGQHRRQAIHQLLDKQSMKKPDSETDWPSHEIGITLFVEDEPKRLRQMFADMAEARPIDRPTKVRFNTSDPFNGIAQTVENESQMVKDRINTKDSVTKVEKDDRLLTGTELKDIVNILATGKIIAKPSSQMSMEYASPEMEEQVENNTIQFLDQFLPGIHADFTQIVNGELTLVEISLKRQDNLLLYPTVMTFMAHCYRAADGDENAQRILAEYLGRQNWEKVAHVRENGKGYLKKLELVNISKTTASKVTLLPKTRPEWANSAKETLRDALTEAATQQGAL